MPDLRDFELGPRDFKMALPVTFVAGNVLSKLQYPMFFFILNYKPDGRDGRTKERMNKNVSFSFGAL